MFKCDRLYVNSVISSLIPMPVLMKYLIFNGQNCESGCMVEPVE